MILDHLNLGVTIALAVCGLADMTKVYARDLMMLQQNSYRNERYQRWFSQSGESTNLGRIFCCVALMFLLVERIPVFASAIVGIVVTIAQLVNLCRQHYKKPLAWTNRAKRIYATMWVISAIIAGVVGGLCGLKALCEVIIAMLIASPLILLAANDLLRPVEKHINRKYYNEAASILASMPDLKIIGITGSYGKTSTKHYLHRILEEHFSTAMTPGSFNTTLGVIRTVREYLKPYNEVFIVEMGAKQPGDIKEICDLVHPDLGIITAVGEQHLESFGSIENVQHTKFELADAIPADGVVVVNEDFPYVANREVKNTDCIRYSVHSESGKGVGGNADYVATDIEYTPEGTRFKLVGPGMKAPLELTTRLIGECNVSNLLAAVIVALKLGVPEEKIKYAVGQIEQVEHRLSLKRTPAGVTIIDDAFNSNPQGSKMALEALAMMKPGKRIVITPGMIELGARQEEANREFGHNIAKNADVAIVVGQYNREAILAGIDDVKDSKVKVLGVDSFAEAQAELQKIVAPGDFVLYENDLPDTFK